MKKIFFVLSVLSSLFFPVLASAQTENTNDCRVESPIMVLRQTPALAGKSILAISRHIGSLIAQKKRLASRAIFEESDREIDIGPGPWLDLDVDLSQDFKRTGPSSNSFLQNSTNFCSHKGSPYTAHLGFDLVNADLGTITFNLGAIGGYQSRKFTVSSTDKDGNEAKTFDSFHISSDGLLMGGYASIYGDSLYAFGSYTQHTMPIEVTPATTVADEEVQRFHEESVSSLGGGIGLVADAGVRIAFHVSGHIVESNSKAKTIKFDSNLSKAYQPVNLSWIVANSALELGFGMPVQENRIDFAVSNNVVVILNRGDDTFNSLGTNGVEQLLDLLTSFYSSNVKLDDSSVYNTIGGHVKYSTLGGLDVGAGVYHTFQIADGASIDNASYEIQLTANYSF